MSRVALLIYGGENLHLLSAALDTELYHGGDMLNGVGAVILEPLGDYSHKTVDVESNKVVPVRFCYAIAVKNRDDNMTQQSGIAVIKMQRTGVFNARTEQTLIFFDVAQVRYQVFRRHKIQLIERTVAQLRYK